MASPAAGRKGAESWAWVPGSPCIAASAPPPLPSSPNLLELGHSAPVNTICSTAALSYSLRLLGQLKCLRAT
eukprot:7428190-Pyramimonas_sp.AAC.1